MHLDSFCEICEADEVVLFERTTILVIANAARVKHPDIHRFEKISSIIKQFNPSGRYVPAQAVLMIACSWPIATTESRRISKAWKFEAERSARLLTFLQTTLMWWSLPLTHLSVSLYGLYVCIQKILNNSLVVESAVTLHNISVARKHFKLLEIDRAWKIPSFLSVQCNHSVVNYEILPNSVLLHNLISCFMSCFTMCELICKVTWMGGVCVRIKGNKVMCFHLTAPPLPQASQLLHNLPFLQAVS